LERVRPITITAASIAFIIFGFVNIIFGGFLGFLLSTTTNPSEEAAIAAGGLIIVIAVLGVFDVVVGMGLWRMKRWASVMGMLIGVFGLITQNFFYYFILLGGGYPVYSLSVAYAEAGTGTPWVNIILVFLIAMSWKSFEPSST